MGNETLSWIILRVGLAFAFLYPAVNAIFDPNSWLGYFPPFVHGYVSDAVLLHSFGAVEVILALWILSGWRIFYPSALAFVMLAAIIVLDWHEFQILFRDVSIASIALALTVHHRDQFTLLKSSAANPY